MKSFLALFGLCKISEANKINEEERIVEAERSRKYYSLEYRKDIEELKRQLNNERSARKIAEEAANKSIKEFIISGSDIRKIMRTRQVLEALLQEIK